MEAGLLSATDGLVPGSFYIMSFHGLITIGLLGYLWLAVCLACLYMV